MTTHFVRFREKPSGYSWRETVGKTYEADGTLDGYGVVFAVPSQYNRGARFGLTYLDANFVGRDETAGPLTQGARAWLSALPTVIYAGPRMPEPRVVQAQPGDLIVDEKLDVVVRITPGTRWSDPGAEVLAAPPATEDYSELIATENAKPREYPSEAYLSG